MKQKLISNIIKPVIFIWLLVITGAVSAQTDIDGLMMEKNAFCVGPMAGYSSWKNYWEGTLKRDNANLGTVSATQFSIMGNYGLTNKLNILFGLPYIKTKASAGQLKGQKGLQDLALWVKWKAYSEKIGSGRLSLFLIGGYSLPVSDYTADFLPLSIGLESKNLSVRGMADYQRGSWFATVSGTYVRRSNIKIDRDAYYTTEMHYSNEVEMPDMAAFNFRSGYRDKGLIAEATADNMTTLGGFDITRNNMPFPSNKMSVTRIGFNFKYDMPFHPNLSLTGNAFTTVAGRNMGQSSGFNAGIFYVLDFSKKERKNSSNPKN
ncbi:MAG TPA: transporter [Chitinophagaceae bacterium]|nr:transporter [Chitinophagaceae bacterium]